MPLISIEAQIGYDKSSLAHSIPRESLISNTSHISPIPLIARAEQHHPRTAIIDNTGEYTYADLLLSSGQVAACLLDGGDDLRGRRIVFMAPSGFGYVALQWGIWRGGGIAVPLNVSHPKPELEHIVDDSQADTVLAHPDFESILRPIADARNLRFVLTEDALVENPSSLPEIEVKRRAMILYTSGTTGRPKGVVTTHHNIQIQITSLVSAWEWSPDDRILHCLPLHHIHGTINVLSCALWSGALCWMLPNFNAASVWQSIVERDLNLFMAVPTIYFRLIDAWERASAKEQHAISEAAARLRLIVSGSAPLPASTLRKWQQITGHTLLERYGMTEGGMFLSNPLHGERRAGCVGTPLPGVEVRLVDENSRPVEAGTSGEIQVRGPGIFLEYWNQPAATSAAFRNGWFRTGDMAVIEEGNYRILGRRSVDVIKTGAEKVFALEIEEVLRTHPDIRDCAVVGVEDAEWGQRVCVALVLEKGHQMTIGDLRNWAKKRMAIAKVPKSILVLDELPRNTMGKVGKPGVVKLFS